MLPVKQKVFAYITNYHNLLVFSHPYAPEAGIQVPAGTLKEGEQPAEGVMREAYEETGLHGLMLQAFLGEHRYDLSSSGKAEIHRRYFYHLLAPGTLPAIWRHTERFSSEGTEPIVFEFFWVPLPDGVPPLIAGHGALLDQLLTRLSL